MIDNNAIKSMQAFQNRLKRVLAPFNTNRFRNIQFMNNDTAKYFESLSTKMSLPTEVIKSYQEYAERNKVFTNKIRSAFFFDNNALKSFEALRTSISVLRINDTLKQFNESMKRSYPSIKPVLFFKPTPFLYYDMIKKLSKIISILDKNDIIDDAQYEEIVNTADEVILDIKIHNNNSDEITEGLKNVRTAIPSKSTIDTINKYIPLISLVVTIFSIGLTAYCYLNPISPTTIINKSPHKTSKIVLDNKQIVLKYADREVHIRTKPNMKGAIINTVPRNQIVEVKKKHKKWVYIYFFDRASNLPITGWVYSKYFKNEKK